jgi:hypothetical protein
VLEPHADKTVVGDTAHYIGENGVRFHQMVLRSLAQPVSEQMIAAGSDHHAWTFGGGTHCFGAIFPAHINA